MPVKARTENNAKWAELDDEQRMFMLGIAMGGVMVLAASRLGLEQLAGQIADGDIGIEDARTILIGVRNGLGMDGLGVLE